MLTALRTAIELLGGQAALARAASHIASKRAAEGAAPPKARLSQPMISYWLRKAGKVSAEWVLDIEAATEGRVPRHDLRPDLYPPPAGATVAGSSKPKEAA